MSKQSAIIEIRAGTGGEEAALFAADLFNMYSKYAQSQNWSQIVFNSHETGIGGLKQIVFELQGEETFNQIQYEAGVHRVQRIPNTEKKGRLHTSTATVAVLPKPKPGEIKINPQDIEIETFRSSGPGGQHMQKSDSAVRITHLSTGITASSQSERSQGRNKEYALEVLQARLFEKKQMQELAEMTDERKTQIKWAKRSEKIRTYNFPNNRITDHRINKKWHNLEDILSGNLKPIIKSLSENL
ncbi:MAG: PCRF domain-containing protein [Candidatus Pacebacteria bacterium]|nr:PCRF domain-containing protein [Candidatus Paceibacterota bacterium]